MGREKERRGEGGSTRTFMAAVHCTKEKKKWEDSEFHTTGPRTQKQTEK